MNIKTFYNYEYKDKKYNQYINGLFEINRK